MSEPMVRLIAGGIAAAGGSKPDQEP